MTSVLLARSGWMRQPAAQPGHPDAVPLAGPAAVSPRPDSGVVPLGQGVDHAIDTGNARRDPEDVVVEVGPQPNEPEGGELTSDEMGEDGPVAPGVDDARRRRPGRTDQVEIAPCPLPVEVVPERHRVQTYFATHRV